MDIRKNNETIVLILPLKLFPVSCGGQTRIFSMLKSLCQLGYRIELITLSYDGKYFKMIEGYVGRIWVLNSHYITRQSSARAFSSERYPGLSDLVELVCRICRPIAVIAQFTDTAHALEKVPSGILKILDTHDVHYLRRKAFIDSGKKLDYDFSLEEEISEWSRADIIIAIQSEEKKFIKKMCPYKSVIVAGHAVKSFEMLGPATAPGEIFFVGSLYEPNIDGLKAFLDNVWLSILKKHPKTRLNVCGRVCEATLPMLPGVLYHGIVPDLKPFYRSATVVINPVMYGSGLKIKTIEALSYGKCLATTKEGIIGFERRTKPFCITTTVDKSMAEDIARIIENPEKRKKIEKAAFSFAKEQFSPSTCFKELASALSSARQMNTTSQDSLESLKDLKEGYPDDIVTDNFHWYVYPGKHGIPNVSEKNINDEFPVIMWFPSKFPPNDWDEYNKAIYLKRIGRFEEAVEMFDKISERTRDYLESRYLKGSALAALGRYDEAMECFLEFEKNNPERTDVKVSISDLLKYDKKYDEAMEKLNDAEKSRLEPDQDFTDLIDYKKILIAGMRLRETGKFNEAILELGKTGKEAPNYIEMKYQQGLAFEGLGEYEKTIKCFSIVGATYPLRYGVRQHIDSFIQRMKNRRLAL